MGQDNSRWEVWKLIRRHPWTPYSQSHPRRRHYGASYAVSVDTSDASKEKDAPELHPLHRPCVSNA